MGGLATQTRRRLLMPTLSSIIPGPNSTFNRIVPVVLLHLNTIKGIKNFYGLTDSYLNFEL
jgi:hypothetical protein